MSTGVNFTLNTDDRETRRALDNMQRQIVKLQEELRKAGVASQQSGATFDKAMSKSKAEVVALAAAIGFGSGSIVGVIQTAIGKFQEFEDRVRKFSEFARKGVAESTEFLLVQPEGQRQRRLSQAIEMMGRMKVGPEDRGAAFNLIQTIQSARGGDFAAGMRGAEAVMMGRRLAIPLEAGTTAERFGAGAGLPVGAAVSAAFAGGELSALTPKDVASAFPALPFFKDPYLGISVATQLTKFKDAGELEVFTRKAGSAISDVGPLKGFFGRQGLLGQSEAAKLQGLVSAGMTTPESLFRGGVREERELQSLSFILPNLREVLQQRDVIASAAKDPSYLRRELAGLEREVPLVGLTGQFEQVTGAGAARRAFGPGAPGAVRADIESRMYAEALQRSGETGAIGGLFPFTTPEGDLTFTGRLRRALSTVSGEESHVVRELQAIRKELESANRQRPAVRQGE